MGSIDKRITDLEGRIPPPPEDEVAARRKVLLRETLDELARLKASGAVHYRAGRRIEGEDIPLKILGPGYSREDVWRLAHRRVLERAARDLPQPPDPPSKRLGR
jgi:hypothetical protein